MYQVARASSFVEESEQVLALLLKLLKAALGLTAWGIKRYEVHRFIRQKEQEEEEMREASRRSYKIADLEDVIRRAHADRMVINFPDDDKEKEDEPIEAEVVEPGA